MNIQKIFVVVAIAVLLGTTAFAQQTVQVVMPEVENLSGNEVAWLPGQIQDKLKSNFQEYLGMNTVVDAKSEATLKRLQRESEGSGRDENTAIELGKISTAKFAVMTKIRRTGKGYTISADYTDLTTGVQLATATSKDYKTTDELYGNMGAIDEITLILAEKLHIAINPVQKQVLKYGTADLSINDQLTLARQNEEQYKKLMSQFDEQLRALSVSNDLNAVANSKKIEAEKSLLAEKQQSEQRRIVELAEQKKKADEDARLEAQRSEEQKKKRNELSVQAAAKAAEVRNLRMETQGVLGQISVIENKKKALVEIRQSVEARIQELREQAERDKADEANRIRNKAWTSVELENGSPTKTALQRRENQVAEYNKQRDESFQKEAELVKDSAAKQYTELLLEIKIDQERINGLRTVSSMGEELKVSYGTYSGQNNGWYAYLSLYSEGVLLYQDTFLIGFKALTGKDAPNMEKASDAAVQDYADTVDMYNSLLLRGDPILYFEIDYTATAGENDALSQYTFKFHALRVIYTVTGKTVQTISLDKTLERTMSPSWDIRPLNEQVARDIHLQMAQRTVLGKYFDIDCNTRKNETDQWEMTYTWKKDNKGHIVDIDDFPDIIHKTRDLGSVTRGVSPLQVVLTGQITPDLLENISRACTKTPFSLSLDFSNVTGFESVVLGTNLRLVGVREIVVPKSIKASREFFHQFEYIGFCGNKTAWQNAVGTTRKLVGNYTIERINGQQMYVYSSIPKLLYNIKPTSTSKDSNYDDSDWQKNLKREKKKIFQVIRITSYEIL